MPARWKTRTKVTTTNKHAATEQTHYGGGVRSVADVIGSFLWQYSFRLTKEASDPSLKSKIAAAEYVKNLRDEKAKKTKEARLFVADQKKQKKAKVATTDTGKKTDSTKTAETSSKYQKMGHEHEFSSDEECFDEFATKAAAQKKKAAAPHPLAAAHLTARTVMYGATMNSIHLVSKIPSPLWFQHDKLFQPSAGVVTPNIEGVSMTMRVVDFWSDGNLRHGDFISWAEELGFTVNTDFSTPQTKQIGVSCGMVACRVATWLRHGTLEQNGDFDFMTIDVSEAVEEEVIRASNSKIAEKGVSMFNNRIVLPRYGSSKTWYLATEHLEVLADWWNHAPFDNEDTHLLRAAYYRFSPARREDFESQEECDAAERSFQRWWYHEAPSWLHSSVNEPTRFAHLGITNDRLYQRVARDVASVRDGPNRHLRRFIIANDEDSRTGGNHWFTVAYDITWNNSEEDATSLTSVLSETIPPNSSQNNSTSTPNLVLSQLQNESGLPTFDTPATSFGSSSYFLGLGTEPLVSNMAQICTVVFFLSRILAAHAAAMELAAREEYRRLVRSAEINSEMYGFPQPVSEAWGPWALAVT